VRSSSDGPAPGSLGIEAAIQIAGQGFLDHPANEPLRAALHDGALSAEGFLGELLGLVLRCLVLFSAEARGCLHPDDSSAEARRRYARCVSQRLELGSARLSPAGSQRLWAELQGVFRGLARGEPRLALPALGGVFDASRCPWLDAAQLDDHALSSAWVALAGAPAEPPASLERWRELTPEQLGSGYEAVLGLCPALRVEAGQLCWRARAEQPGSLRRRTGSYYTPEHLVQALLDAALEPLVRDTLAAQPAEPAHALTRLSIVDPACGAGYFLLAAARRLAQNVARCAAPDDALADYRTALRRVLTECVCGVDLNPTAVEICRLGLWLEAADARLPLGVFDEHVRHGHALLGATPALLARRVPDAAWRALPGEDRQLARALERRNRRGVPSLDPASPDASPVALPARQKQLADAWCAAFVWPRVPADLDAAPTNELWLPAWRAGAELPRATQQAVAELAARYRFFHWHLEFPHVFARGGFDLVLGNPPWIAHAGRAAQRLPAELKRFYACNYACFADYPTTHGMFVYLAARVSREGGYLGLVVPSSLSELAGYAATRVAHDELCDFPGELIDFGEGQFAGVTQPCMALVSRRSAAGRRSGPVGQPWPVQRNDLDATARGLLSRLAELPALPGELFGERGVQSDRELLQHFCASPAASGRFDTPIREGTDVREFELRAPRWYVDRAALGTRMRPAQEFQRVRLVVRQTARYPIAALSDGLAFRNSLLAVFEAPEWPAAALLALLNSALIRWLHYMRFRDARQPILPQLKISHLRATPAPPAAESAQRLRQLGERPWAELAGTASARGELDALVYELYELDAAERERVRHWHASWAPRPRAPRRLTAEN
jgi:hypothetical protein